jgi:hypothetical protein
VGQKWGVGPLKQKQNFSFFYFFDSNLHKQPKTSNLNRKKAFSQDGPKIKVV